MRRTDRGRGSPTDRGYVMVVITLLLVILMAAGLYGLKAMESDIRGTAHMRRTEILARAASAGASHRLAQIAMAIDAGAAFDTSDASVWTTWPASGLFSADTDYPAKYTWKSAPIATIESRPPPGVQVGAGGQSTIWSITSYAIAADSVAAGEHEVSVGVRVWTRGGGGSY